MANMELLPSRRNSETIKFNDFPLIFSEDTHSLPQFIASTAKVKDSLINQGAEILGNVTSSVISNEVRILEGATVINSVIMPGVEIGKNAYVNNAIIGPLTVIKDNEVINKDSDKIVLIDYERSLS